MLLDTIHTARDLGRLQEIAAVLIRHGFGDAVRRLGLARTLERLGRAVHLKATEGLASKPPQVRVREAFEELGPAFVKLGQILAGRSDLLPPIWAAELSRLHEHARAVPFDDVLAQLTEDLGADPRDLFVDFGTEPLAAASIAQVHRASLADGTPVVLKVRRPGIDQVLGADMRLLERIAVRAEERIPELRRLRPRSLVREFKRSLRTELDLREEARNADRLRANLAGNGIVIPRIHATWTRERLCVMDYLEGVSLGEWLRTREPARVDPRQIAASGADTVLRMIFVDGFFHADPHPGNVVVLATGGLGLLDFGMVGFLSESRRRELLDLLSAVVSPRAEDVAEILATWSLGDEVDLDLLTLDCAAFIDRYYQVPLRELDTSRLLTDLTQIIRENDLFLPHDVALLLKVFLTLDSLGRALDPGFVMAARIEPFANETLRELRSPRAMARRGAEEIGAILTHLPRDLRRLGTRVRRGRIRIEMDLKRLERFGRRIEKSANRMVLGLLTASLIVGSAVVLSSQRGPELLGLPFFGLLAFASSIVAGFVLFVAILRSGRE